MKVAWICHFSNAEIQSILHPGISDNEFAPWITNLAKLFENESGMEIHIVSQHNRITGYRHFVLRKINYHFFNPDFILFGKSFARFHLDYKSHFLYMKFEIRKIINKIKPDLIHLHGVEVDHSSSIFQFKNKYPVLVTVQGFVSHATNQDDYFIKKRIRVEQIIFQSFRHFGYRTQAMGKDIKKYSPQAELHWHHYPFPEISPRNAEKKYDAVYFARVTKDKGIEDLLRAIAIVKKQKTDISLCVIGGTNSDYIDYLKKLVAQLEISENIYWAGYLPNHKDVHKLASAARISILPTYNEIISGTIIESMFLKLPVIAYDMGSIHEVNDKEEYIDLVPKGDVNVLAKKIISILQDSENIQTKGEKLCSRALAMFDNKPIVNDLFKAYQLVINDFKKN